VDRQERASANAGAHDRSTTRQFNDVKRQLYAKWWARTIVHSRKTSKLNRQAIGRNNPDTCFTKSSEIQKLLESAI